MPAKNNSIKLLLLIFFLSILVGCGPRTRRLGQDQVLDIAWRALEPITSSQNRGNWEMVQARKVAGREVVNEFASFPISTCPGPMPPENLAVRSSSEYWYILAVPRHLVEGEDDPTKTEEAAIAEPILKYASFLIDPFSGQIVARHFDCGE